MASIFKLDKAATAVSGAPASALSPNSPYAKTYPKINGLEGVVCVVTGGCGFLGSTLTQMLLDQGAVVRVLDAVVPENNKIKHANVTYTKGSITDAKALDSVFQGAEIVFHAASVIAFRLNDALKEVNIRGTQKVIEACKRCGVKRLIYTSSSSVVLEKRSSFDVPDDAPYPADHKIISPYGITKAAAERSVLAANSNDLLTCALRPSALTGCSATSVQISAVEEGVTMVPEDVVQDIIYIEDVAYAHVLAASKLTGVDSPAAGKAYNIGGHSVYLQKAIIDGARYIKPDIKVQVLPYYIVLMLAFVSDLLVWLSGGRLRAPFFTLSRGMLGHLYYSYSLDNRKAERELGFKPLYSVEDMFQHSAYLYKLKKQQQEQ